jgi:hypothetical protein
MTGRTTPRSLRTLLRLDDPPETRLASLVDERRRRLEEQVGRLDDSSLDLERREEVLRDSRASLERLLRLGANDLDAREAELAERLRELDVRERGMAAEEIELDRRRGELGAVELRRASIELRERALDEREAELVEREDRVTAVPDTDADVPELAFVPGPAYGLVELENGAGSTVGAELELNGVAYVIARIGPSPLPADPRRCAYLMRAREPARS